MDIRLPGMDGLEATRRIMSRKPVPIVVVAASIESGKWNTTPMEALRAGALTVLEKPVGTTHADYAALAERLCTQLVIMSQVKLVRRQRSREARRRTAAHSAVSERRSRRVQDAGNCLLHRRAGALVQLLGALGPDFPLPILLVQHMTASFIAGFASWLDSVCPFSVTVVKDGCIPVAGTRAHGSGRAASAPGRGRLRLDAEIRYRFSAPRGRCCFNPWREIWAPTRWAYC